MSEILEVPNCPRRFLTLITSMGKMRESSVMLPYPSSDMPNLMSMSALRETSLSPADDGENW